MAQPPEVAAAAAPPAPGADLAPRIPELLGHAPDSVLLCDAGAFVLDANEEACRSLGYDHAELVRKHVRDFVEGLAGDALAEMIQVMKARGVATFRALHRRKDGTRFPVETRLALVRRAGPPFIVCFARDVSADEEAARALRASEARYQRLVELLPDGVLTYAQGRIGFANAAAARNAGAARAADLVGSPLLDHVHPEARPSVGALLERVARGEVIAHVDQELVRLDGTRYPADVSAAPLGEGEGLVVVRDLTEPRRAERERAALAERLVQAEKLEALGTLAGGVAHDFNNLLAAILGHSGALSAELPPDHPGRGDADEIAAAAHRAEAVVQQILAFSRRRPLEARPVDVARAVEEELAVVRAATPSTVRLALRLDPDAGAVMADPAHLRQVLLNLCANARDALGAEGGTVEVEVAGADAPAAGAPPGLAPGPHVRLAVRDDGPGMDPATRARAFEPYFTTKPVGAGSGLGLSVVHGLAVALGGAVSLETAPGRGTAVTVWLPRAAPLPPPAAEQGGPPAADAGRSVRARLLLVEDDPPVSRAVSRMLESLGYAVAVCGDGGEALARFRADPASFDVVLTDQTLPGMRGDALVPALLAIRPDLPVLLWTGYSEHLDEERARALGARGLLAKPLDLAHLGEALRAALAR